MPLYVKRMSQMGLKDANICYGQSFFFIWSIMTFNLDLEIGSRSLHIFDKGYSVGEKYEPDNTNGRKFTILTRIIKT